MERSGEELGVAVVFVVAVLIIGLAIAAVTNRPTVLDTKEREPTRIEWRGKMWLPVEEKE